MTISVLTIMTPLINPQVR